MNIHYWTSRVNRYIIPKRFAEVSARHFGFDRSNMEGAGAAGGLGYASLQYLDAECQSGVQLLLEMVGFDEIVRGTDFVITGEGAADGQTLMGKLPWGVLQHAQGVPVVLIAGQVRNKEQLKLSGFSHVECINPPDLPLQEAMQKEVARQNISNTINRIVRSKYGL